MFGQIRIVDRLQNVTALSLLAATRYFDQPNVFNLFAHPERCISLSFDEDK